MKIVALKIIAKKKINKLKMQIVAKIYVRYVIWCANDHFLGERPSLWFVGGKDELGNPGLKLNNFLIKDEFR